MQGFTAVGGVGDVSFCFYLFSASVSGRTLDSAEGPLAGASSSRGRASHRWQSRAPNRASSVPVMADWAPEVYKRRAVFLSKSYQGVHLTTQLSKVVERLILPIMMPHITLWSLTGRKQFETVRIYKNLNHGIF